MTTENCAAGLEKKIEEWLAWDKNEATSSALKKLVAEKNIEELKRILLNRISFGTAGLRGRMSVGYACMNDLVIIQTAQGFFKYLVAANADLLKANGIIVGYDGRHNSRRWAELTAAVFIHGGYPVKLFSTVTPTPFIPFSVKKYKCASGVMVTASHNPKDDNGYKVYAPNGAQIIPPADKDIQDSILQNLKPLESSWNTSILTDSKLLTDPLQEVLDHYLKIIDDTIIPEHKQINEKVGMLFTYTAMHGVGYPFVEKIFNRIGIKMVPVVEQRDPHPDFPTVKFPNPEEGKSSLNLSFKTADANNSVVIIANDPDADRMGAAEKDQKTGEWKIFTGNELGALLGWWMLHCYKIKNPNAPLNKVCMIASTVSSMILRSMGKIEGFNFYDTLTGFKWMEYERMYNEEFLGNLTLDLEKEGKEVIFAFEESIGYMCTNTVLDKDGVSGAFQFATMTSLIYSENKTLADKLEEIFSIYGRHVTRNSYYICYDPVVIKRVFERIRNFSGKNTYPKGILNNKYQITSVRDLTTGYDNNQPDNKAILPVSSSSEMITFQFSNDAVCTLRTSGTEPKIKYYTELCASPTMTDKKIVMDTLNEMADAICEELLEPKKNNLESKSD